MDRFLISRSLLFLGFAAWNAFGITLRCAAPLKPNKRKQTDSLFRRNGRHGKENVRHMLDAVGTDKDFRAKKEKQKRRGKRKRRDHRILRRVFAKMRGLVVDVPLSHGLSRIPDAAEPIVENRRDDPPHRTVHYEYLSRNPGAASRFL